MSLPTIVIVQNSDRDVGPLFDFPLKRGEPSGDTLERKSSSIVTEITDIDDAAYTEESAIPPGCLPKGHEQSIDLSERHLERFPVNVFAICKHLTFLFLQENLLEKLPEELFSTFPSLRRLDVRRNKLTSVPEKIGDHPALQVLLLQDNKIASLPPHLGHCKTLRNLQLQGNPLIWPEENIVRQGIVKLLAYLRENDESPSQEDLEDQKQASQEGKNRLQKSRISDSDDSRNPTQYVVPSRKGSALSKYAELNIKGGGESYSKEPRYKSNSKMRLLRRKLPALFDDENQATLVCTRGQFPLGYQKRISYVPPKQIHESLRRELWKDLLRQEMLLQDYLLQKQRDSEALRNWRQKTRTMQLTPKRKRAAFVPFDQDESLKMMTWRELLQARNLSLEKKGPSKPGLLARRAPNPSEGLLKLLQDIDKLKEAGKKMSGQQDEISQCQYRMNLSNQINKLRDLQKALRSIRII